MISVTVLILGTLESPAYADSVRNAEWHLRYLHAPQAQQVSRGEGVTVGLLDTGVDASQPDITGNILPGIDEYDNQNGDGRQDKHGHGTGLAAIIAGHGRAESDGVLGIAPGARILPVRISESGNAFPGDVRQAIVWAAKRRVKVMCIASAAAPNIEWRAVLDEALSADIVIVAAVGNRTQGDTVVGWPAAYPGVLAAAGIDQNGKHAELSVTGPEVDLAAPAVNIVTAGLHGQYVRADGTSAATAIIAGAAALVRAKYPNLPAAEVVHRLEATAIDAGPPGRDDQYGYGILNLVGALTADVPPLPASPSASSPKTSSATAEPAAEPPGKSSSLPLVGLLLAVLLAAGGVVAVITMRRQRH